MSLFFYLKSHVSLYDVVSDFVSLKRAGGYFKGTCPFHNEKDASFTISPDKQIFYCFGCKVGGDVIAFISKIEGLSQFEAAQYLIEHYRIKVPDDILQDTRTSSDLARQKKTHFIICKHAAEWFHKKLLSSQKALVYLQQRSIHRDTAITYMIGCFERGMIDRFIEDMAASKVLVKDLIQAGIIFKKNNQVYSPFEDRIIFPVKDVMGRFCGFGGRIFKPDDTRPKYYNSAHSAWFDKSSLLFGLDKAKQDMKEHKRAFLVEGYIDLVIMAQYGFATTVATLGTSCTKQHLKILSRYIETLYVIYDGDDAGHNAIMRIIALCWQADIQLRVVSLPSGHDPASFLSAGMNMNHLIETSQDIFLFFVTSQGQDFKNKTFAEKMRSARRIVSLITTIPDRLKQDILLQEAASTMQLSFDSLKKMMRMNHHEMQDVSHQKIPKLSREEKILRAVLTLFQEGKSYFIPDELMPFFSSAAQEVLHACRRYVYERDKKDTCHVLHGLLEHLSPDAKSLVLPLSVEPYVIDMETFEQLLLSFQKNIWKQRIQQLKCDLGKARESNDSVREQELLASFSRLKLEMQDKGFL